MAIRRKRKNNSKTSQAAARRQKIERRKLLLENLEDRRLLAGIPQLSGIQIPGDLEGPPGWVEQVKDDRLPPTGVTILSSSTRSNLA